MASQLQQAESASLTVVTMAVPCCLGLARLAQEAVLLSRRQVPLSQVVVSVQGEVVEESTRGGHPVG